MKNILKRYLSVFSLVMVMSVSSAVASELSVITNDMHEKVNSIMIILKNEKLLRCEQDSEIGAISKGMFDYALMSRLSVGKKIWKSATKEQRKDFIHFFQMRMKQSYIEKAHLLSDEKVTVHDAVQVKPTRIHLTVMIQGKEEDTELVYKYYRAKNQKWLIYDVQIAGISILKTYRAQFADVLDRGDMQELINQLKPKLSS